MTNSIMQGLVWKAHSSAAFGFFGYLVFLFGDTTGSAGFAGGAGAFALGAVSAFFVLKTSISFK